MKYLLGYCLKIAVFYLDIISSLGFSIWVVYISVPVLLYRAPVRQLLLSTSVITIFLIAGIFISPSGLDRELAILNRSIMVAVLWTLLSHLIRLKKAEEAQRRLYVELEASTREVKLLRGILPICSVCKKIRDPKGAAGVIHTRPHRG